jgi:glycosyltransferase involved in cell wall biosynthesis
MKILMVSEDLPGERIGGLGKHVVTLANALLAGGHEVEILGRGDTGAAGGAAQVGFAGRFIGGFDYRHPGWKELQLGVFNPLKRPWFARKIGRAIALHAGRFDVVHYHGHLPMVGLHVARALNFVQTRHDQGSECLTHLRWRAEQVCGATAARDCSACIHARAGPLRQSVTALAVDGYRRQAAATFARHKTIFVSDFLRRQFLRAVPGADLSRSRVIHNFVAAGLLARLAAREQGAEPGRILLAGRIDAGKGFREFLGEAARRLPPGVHLDIAGDGPERIALKSLYESARIRFLGWQPYDQLIRLAARSALCVVPSVCEEACSTTVLEALALGKPCVALARGGTPELAAYQRYDGQLQLAASMGQLADIALALAQRPTPAGATCAATFGSTFGADAALAVPRLLECYADPA